MYRLQKDNVERLAATENDKVRLEAKGFKLLSNANNIGAEEKNIDKMNITELKRLAKENGIDGFEKMKKEEIIVALLDKEHDVNE